MKVILRILEVAVVLVAIIIVIESIKNRPRPQVIHDDVDKSNYVMLDDSCCLHLPGCMSLKYSLENRVMVKYIDTTDVRKENIQWFCPVCIRTNEYKHIQAILRRNEDK